jgi:hypothetical protein
VPFERILKSLLKAPVVLYTAGAGWVLGKRFLLLGSNIAGGGWTAGGQSRFCHWCRCARGRAALVDALA